MKILQLINKLSASDKRHIKEAISSPFFNKNDKLSQVWDALLIYKEEVPAEIKLNIHKTLFKKDKYDDLAIRHLLSKLQKLLEEIIGIIKLQEEGQTISLAYTKWLNEQELTTLHERQLNHLSQDTPQKLSDYFWHYHWLQEFEYFSRKYEANYDRELIPVVSDSFDQYYIIHKLKITCLAYSLDLPLPIKSANGLMERILINFEHREPTEPLVLLYYLCLQCFKTADGNEYFTRLKISLPLPSLPIDYKERTELFELTLTFCVKMIKEGKPAYLDEALDLYESMLDLSLIQQDTIDFPRILKNIATEILKLDNCNWVAKLFAMHIKHLNIEHSVDYEGYNTALVLFELNKFQEALEQLRKVTFASLAIGQLTHILLLKTYYELGKTDNALAQLDAFKQFLSNKDLPNSEKQNGQSLLKYMKLLFNLDADDKAMKKLLSNQIKTDEGLMENKWLTEKLEAIQ